jgi:DNA-binding IclR family transcriptional regulator
VQHPTPSPLALDVCELLDSCIDTIEALDALLLLLREPSRWWALVEVAHEIDANADEARRALAALRTRGLAADAGSSTLFRLAPLDPFAHAAFTSLARACTTERGAVVEHIARRSMARFRVLAEAFTRARGS